ncbi:MAG: pilin [Candidatus Pacebacteria bacterium]|nr:pilin [Candidatus Paceibacterota bacterium]
MKKILSIFAVVSLLAVLVLPVVSLAEKTDTADTADTAAAAPVATPATGGTVPKGNEIPNGCNISNNIESVGCPASGSFCGPDTDNAGTPASGCGDQLNMMGICCMLNTIYTVTNWVFYIMTLVAVLMIVFGGFTYITAAGDPAKAGKGKSILTFAIIGLAIALIAKLIPSLVRFILGV